MAEGHGGKEEAKDYGKEPWVVNIEDLTKKNEKFRQTKWTGDYIINAGDTSLKVYVLYAPPEHPAATLHKTFEEAEADHHH